MGSCAQCAVVIFLPALHWNEQPSSAAGFSSLPHNVCGRDYFPEIDMKSHWALQCVFLTKKTNMEKNLKKKNHVSLVQLCIFLVSFCLLCLTLAKQKGMCKVKAEGELFKTPLIKFTMSWAFKYCFSWLKCRAKGLDQLFRLLGKKG